MTDVPPPLFTGIDVSDPNQLGDLANTLSEILGHDWVSQERAAAPGTPVLDVIRALGRIPVWEECLRRGDSLPEDAELFFRFSMVAHVFTRAKKVQGFEIFQDELRSLARARVMDRFYDKVFEAEVAVYLSDRMGANWTCFGPKSGHPDVWAGFPVLGSQLLLPTECKRISPLATHNREIDTLAEKLDQHLRSLSRSFRPMKTILWLHERPASIRVEELGDSLTVLVDRLKQSTDETAWVTLSDNSGRFQLSVALLGRAGEFQPPGFNVADVPSAPALLVRSEVRRTSETNVEVRITSLLSVRSDLKPPPVGNFRERLNDAIEQLVLLESPTPGAVALRIRPPRDLGDIYEHDRLVRMRLASTGGERAALVILFWNVSERSEGAERVTKNGEAGREIIAAYHLRPYFITNPASPLKFTGLDSFDQYFKQGVPPLMRDAESGSLVAISAEEIEGMKAGTDLPQQIHRVGPSPEEPFNETEGAATILARFGLPVGSLPADGPLGAVMAGSRQFRLLIDKEKQLRVVELVNGIPRAVSTIDLRAWWSQSVICATVEWSADHFQAGVRTPDDTSRILAKSSRLRPLPPFDVQPRSR